LNPFEWFQRQKPTKLKLTSDGKWYNTEIRTQDGVLIPGVRSVNVTINTGEPIVVDLSIIDMEIDMDIFGEDVNSALKRYDLDEQ
jgi:hypothetical protein